MSKSVGAIVLAAGFSSRFGSSKLLAPLQNGNSVFEQSLLRITTAIPSVLVVTRPDMAPLLKINPSKAELVVFEEAERGMGASLAFASNYMSQWSGCLICLADMPFISTESYSLIANQLNTESIVIPSYQSKTGNPVAFGKKFFAELSQLSGDSGGKNIIQSHPNSISRLALDDPGILQDIDTIEDLSHYQ